MVGGDLSKAFDQKTMKALVSTPDLIGAVLRVHFCLEELLNLWCEKITSVQDFFDIGFIGFEKKLLIAEKLGFPEQLSVIFRKFNKIRNMFAHDSNTELSIQMLDDIRHLIDRVETYSDTPLPKTSELRMFGDQGVKYDWSSKNVDIKDRLVFIYFIFSLTLVHRYQYEFIQRNISHNFDASKS